MKRFLLTIALGAAAVSVAFPQSAWNTVSAFTDYTDATNPVQPGGNNLLQGAVYEDWISNNSWSVLSGGPFTSYTGNNFTTGKITYTAPSGRGDSQWMAQMKLTTNYQVEKGKRYDLSFHVKSSAANNFTVKVEDVNNPDQLNMAYTYVKLPADQELLFVMHDISPETTIPEAKLVFDAGGAEVGSTVEIYDIILQSADELSSGGPVTLMGAPEGYELVWSDEFDDPSTLSTKWNAMDWKAGNVNNELQTYKPASQSITASDGSTMHTAEIKDGNLVINCFNGADDKIYSGRFDSYDANGNAEGYAAWRYGYIEARIKLPKGSGTWPAFWMMPVGVNWSDETWPTCGEIDIMEEVGNDPDNCVSSLHAIGHYHANNTQVSASRHIDGMEGGWVTYAMLWTNENISMYANGQRILTYNNDHEGYVNWPYDRLYYVTLNLAFGGDWGGAGNTRYDRSALPLSMEVDYVRVYQLPEERLNTDGSGSLFIHGPYNGIAKDGIVPSSTFSNWHQNYIPLADDNKTYTQEFIVGKNLHPNRVKFQIAATADRAEGTIFTPAGKDYRLTVEENPLFLIGEDGTITLKNDARLRTGEKILLTVDCSEGTGNAVMKVDYTPKDVAPVAKPEGIWIIGADRSVVPGMIDSDSWNWQESKSMKMVEKYADVYSYDFVLDETLSRNTINFKFFCQNGFTDADGKEVAFVYSDGDYLIYADSEYFGIGGDGGQSADNGNVYKKKNFPADAKEIEVIVDCRNGYDNARLYTSLDEAYSGVENVMEESEKDDAWYDLLGRKMDRPNRPGIYIHNHKKVVVR